MGKGKREKVFRYIMMNKPLGVITATEDREQETVMDLLPISISPKGLFPVGRLDKDTTGLLIITDDGDFCHRATHPKKHIPKLYEVRSFAPMTAEDVEAFAAGILLRDGTRCQPASLVIDEKDPCCSKIKIFEGKYHQVKRMYAARGNKVIELKRLSIGGLRLDDSLEVGMIRHMTKEEAETAVHSLVTKY